MRRLAAASAILATILVAGAAVTTAPSAAAASPTDPERATAALGYLLKAQGSNGSIDSSLGETSDFVIGAAAAGYDPAMLQGCTGTTGALDFIATASDAASGDASKTGKAILAVVAGGRNPASFHGRNLGARLNALYHAGSGKFGGGRTFEQSFGILAFHASGVPVPAAATSALKALQDPDGSWSYGSGPVAAGQGDTNSTAIALMALDMAGVHSADAAGFAYLQSQQLADGGFPYQNSTAWGPPASDPDSDSIVLEAILAAGGNPTAAAWSKGPANVLTQVRTMQAADGGFTYPGTGESAFTTSQVPAALMRSPYGAAVHFTAGRAVSRSVCAPAATPTPTPTPKATPTPSATPARTATPKPTARPTRKPTPRPTVRPTAAPTEAATLLPATTPSPIPTPTPKPTVAPTPTPTFDDSLVAGASAAASPGSDAPTGGSDAPTGGSGGVPAPLVYGLAVAAGLALVVGAGWFLVLNPNRKP